MSPLSACCCSVAIGIVSQQIFVVAAVAADPPAAAPVDEEKLRGELASRLERLSAAIEQKPGDVTLVSQRGDVHLFLGRFNEALADYDRMAELRPELAETHWRRGIACFYAGKYEDAAAQFERCYGVDKVDRENGIWHFMSRHRAHGETDAREHMLAYEGVDREPFPNIYKMFAGQLTPEEFEKSAVPAELPKEARAGRAFYAHLYLGIYHTLKEEWDTAARHLDVAVASPWPAASGYGPAYMGHVARLHRNMVREKRQPPDAAAR